MINWSSFCEFAVKIEKFSKYIEPRDCYYLCKNVNITEKIIEKFPEKNYLDFLSKNTNISEKYFDEQLCKNKKVDWISLLNNGFRTTHSSKKIISWLKKNEFFAFDKLIYKYI